LRDALELGLLAGQVNLTVSSRAGAEKIVSIVSPGESFAEAVMFMEAPTYPVSAVAAATSAVVKLCNAEFLALLRESHETSLRMLAGLSKRLHQRLREIEYLTLESATCRLVRAIESRLVDDNAGPTEIMLVESRQELASRLSMKPETLSRILRNLSDCGAIVVNGRSVHIPDRRRLLAVLDDQGSARSDG
jgi:CRP-like cAMP-binding protein